MPCFDLSSRVRSGLMAFHDVPSSVDVNTMLPVTYSVSGS